MERRDSRVLLPHVGFDSLAWCEPVARALHPLLLFLWFLLQLPLGAPLPSRPGTLNIKGANEPHPRANELQYIDIKAKCRHLNQLPVKGLLNIK
jgi:hypothetical protein